MFLRESPDLLAVEGRPLRLERIRIYITHGPRQSGAVCLTFDDGPHPEHTPQLLDLLAKFQVPATFFLVGEKAEKLPDVIRRMAAEGHAIGSHTYSHTILTSLTSQDSAREVRRGVETIADILGERPNLYRPPHGKVSAGDLWRLWRAGLTTVLWNIDPKDYNKQSANALWDTFQAQTIRGGDVILFHDIYHHTIECLPEVIASIRRRGLEFTTVKAWTK